MKKDYVKAYILRGDIFLGLEKFDESIAEYNKAKDVNP
jgi:predicted negative regulator of RcsB-dependent stress response